MSWGIACCPNDGEPLIPTMAFRHKEFICLGCGRLFEFLQPRGKHGAEVEARYDQLKAEWDEHASGLMPESQFWRESCPRCELGRGASHHEHATEEEREADRRAREWLRERVATRC